MSRLPSFARRSARSFPERPMCAGTHWRVVEAFSVREAREALCERLTDGRRKQSLACVCADSHLTEQHAEHADTLKGDNSEQHAEQAEGR